MADYPAEEERLHKLYQVMSEKVAQNPDSADLHAQLGAVCLDLERRREALGHLLTAVELDPKRQDLIDRIKRRLPEEDWRHVVFPSRRRPFWQDPGTTFGYALAKQGLITIAAGAFLFALVNMVPLVAPLLIMVFVYPLLAAYMMKIINHSAEGGRAMPDWPEISDLWDSIFRPAFQMLFALMVAFGPAVILFLAGIRTTSSMTISGILLIAGVAAGFILLPAILMTVSLFNNALAALNFPLMFRAIGQMPRDYLIALGFLALIMIVGLPITLLLIPPIPLVGHFVYWALGIYFTTTQMYIVGNLYFVNENRLGWF